jgi:hypothetical protein
MLDQKGQFMNCPFFFPRIVCLRQTMAPILPVPEGQICGVVHTRNLFFMFRITPSMVSPLEFSLAMA